MKGFSLNFLYTSPFPELLGAMNGYPRETARHYAHQLCRHR